MMDQIEKDVSAEELADHISHFDPRSQPIYELYRRFRKVVMTADAGGDSVSWAREVLVSLLDSPEAAGGPIAGGRIYRRSGAEMELVEKVGEAGEAPIGFRLPLKYPLVQEAIRKGSVLVRSSDPRIDPSLEEPGYSFAAIVVGPRRQTIVSFTLREPVAHELDYAVATLQAIAETTWRRRELAEFIEQAESIQTSLLPQRPKAPLGFELACRTRPAEIVGGDFYDAQQLPTGSFVLTIGDAIGHGLPAALLARDVVVGLRMGMENQLTPVATVQRLAAVMVRSGTGHRFVSLFYSELDPEGDLIYVNAGHVAPLIVGQRSGRVSLLTSTGPVLGPSLPKRLGYRRAFERLAADDVLALFTDGITEATNPCGEEYGLRRLALALRAAAGEPLQKTIDRIFHAVDEFSETAKAVDDQTLTLVRRS